MSTQKPHRFSGLLPSIGIAVAALTAGLTSMAPATVQAGDSGRTLVDYIRVDPADGVVRVKPVRDIANPAACQSTAFMVIPLNDPNLQLFLASLYTATATDGARIKLFGTGDCTALPGSETIEKVTLFAPE